MNNLPFQLNGIGGPGDNGFMPFNSPDTMDRLSKALQVGFETNAPSMTGGRSLVGQSLDSVLKLLTYDEKFLRIWPDIDKKKASSTVEEYTKQKGYGSQVGSFITEGMMAGNLPPSGTDADYQRAIAKVKFIATLRAITHVAATVKGAYGDAVERETKNGTMFILEQLENRLFEGNSNINSAEFDGVFQQLIADFSGSGATQIENARNSDNVIDMRGQSLSEEYIETGANTVLSNYGAASHLYLSTTSMAELSKVMFPRQRVDLPVGAGGLSGYPWKGHSTNATGPVLFRSSIFMNPAYPGAGRRIKRSGDSALVAPGNEAYIPRITGGACTVTKVAGSSSSYGQWTGYLSPTVNHYLVTAQNMWGESAPVTMTATNTSCDAVGDALKLDITAATSGTGVAWDTTDPLYGPVAVNIYRYSGLVTPDSSSIYYRVASVAWTDQGEYVDGHQSQTQSGTAGSGHMFYYDLNETLPGFSNAYLIQHDPDVLAFLQLLPLLKIPLAWLSLAERFALVLYGTPVYYAPKKMVVYRNVR